MGVFDKRSTVEDSTPFEFELFDDRLPSDESEVGFGAGTTSARPWIIGVVLAAVLVVVVLVAMSVGRDNSSAADEAVPTLSTIAGSATTERVDRTTATSRPQRTTTVPGPVGTGGPLIATDQPWSILSFDPNQGNMYAIDVQTGNFERVSGDDGFFGGVGVATPEGMVPIPRNAATSACGPIFYAGPGAYWTTSCDSTSFNGAPSSLVRFRADGTLADMTEEFTARPGEFLVGSMADGSAVVSGPNGRPYLVLEDNGRQQLADGAVDSVTLGMFNEVRCAGDGECVLVLHSSSGEVALAYDVQRRGMFSPDGSRAALRGSNELAIVDIPSGAGPAFMLDDSVLMQQNGFYYGWFGNGTGPVGWTPDSRWAITSTGRSLFVVDATTGATSSFDLPRQLSDTVVIAVVDSSQDDQE
jgi:hypothetical protein